MEENSITFWIPTTLSMKMNIVMCVFYKATHVSKYFHSHSPVQSKRAVKTLMYHAKYIQDQQLRKDRATSDVSFNDLSVRLGT